MNDVKWLLTGAGDIAGRRVAPALVEAHRSELIAVCDINRANAVRLADRFGVKTVFADPAHALAESGANAVYIATPQDKHVEMCLQALEAGRHFLCEKPLGINGAECLTLLHACRRSDRIASCSNYRRLSEQYKATVAIVESGEIGPLVGGWMTYSTPPYDPGKSRQSKAVGGGPIKGLGFYIIDIAINLFGMPASAMAQTSTLTPETDLEDIAAIALRFPNGALFTITINTNSPGTRHVLELFGTEGRIYWPQWPPHGNGPIVKITRKGTETVDTLTPENYHLPMVEDFVAAVLGNRQPLCTIESATRTEVVTDAIYLAAETGRLEPVIWMDGQP